MRKITPNEALCINKLLGMETNALAMSRATLNVVSDEQLAKLTKAGIQATEARIKGIQQFVTENGILQAGEAHAE